MSTTVAICVGHSRKIDNRYEGGAYSSSLKSNERNFNIKVANELSELLNKAKISNTVISNYNGTGYTAAMRDVAEQVKKAQASLAIELHFNSASPSATGHEWLYWHSSIKGKAIAERFNECFTESFPNIKSRGIKAIKKTDRGGKFLELTSMPAVILEPFFGSNEEDCAKITPKTLAISYSKMIILATQTLLFVP